MERERGWVMLMTPPRWFRRPPSPVLRSREPFPSLGLKTLPLSLPSIFPSIYWVLWFVTYITRNMVTIKSCLFIKKIFFSSFYVFQIPNCVTSLPSPPTCNTQKRRQKTPTRPSRHSAASQPWNPPEGLLLPLYYTMHPPHLPEAIERKTRETLGPKPYKYLKNSSLFMSCLKKKILFMFLPSF